jgi:hypothetical protein
MRLSLLARKRVRLVAESSRHARVASPTKQTSGGLAQWCQDVRELWWVPSAVIPPEVISVVHPAQSWTLGLEHILALELLAVVAPIVMVPIAKETAYRWAMEIRYGRKEAARRRRYLP